MVIKEFIYYYLWNEHSTDIKFCRGKGWESLSSPHLAAVVRLQHTVQTHNPMLASECLLKVVQLKVLVANLDLQKGKKKKK